MKSPLAVFAAVAIALTASNIKNAQATITLTADYGALFQFNGSQIPVGSLGILVADTGVSSGIVDPVNTVLSQGNFLGGSSDDLILGVFSSINLTPIGGTNVGFQFELEATYSGNFNAGDKLYLLWFPTISTLGSTVGAGVSYGAYRSDTPNLPSGATPVTGAFIAPADGSLVNISALFNGPNDIAPGSPVTQADFTANLTTVPEPSAVALFGIAALSITLFRRRRARA